MIINWIGQILGLRDSARPHGSMEPLLRSSAIDEPSSLSSVVDSPDLLHKELERARRYERGLSISVITVEPLNAGGNGDLRGNGDGRVSVTSSGPPQVVALLAAAGLRDMLRQSDVLCYQPTENRFVLALAESDAEEARKALRRISGIFRERLELDVRAGTARFPDDALTLSGLIDSAASTGADADGGSPVGPSARGGGNGNGGGRQVVAFDRRAHLRGNGDGAAAGNGNGAGAGNGNGTKADEDGWHGGNGRRPQRRVTPLEVKDDE